jgi:predicted transcriptional regulator
MASIFRRPGLALNVIAAGALAAAAAPASAALPVGQKPPAITLSGDAGGKTDGTPWSSEAQKGKVWTLFYVDPDHESANPELEKDMKAANFPHDKYATVAVINMAATWKPNAIISSVLKSRQEEFPDTTYVKDMDKALVEKWKMTDSQYDVVVFDKQGAVLFARDGEFSKQDIQTCIEAIRKHLAD